MSKKIPVVIFDSGLKGDNYVSFVATDNFKGGQLGGERLIESIGGKGRVVLLRYAEGHDSTTKREEGFLAAMKANPAMEVVELESVRRHRCRGSLQAHGIDSQHLQEAGRQPEHRRDFLRERVVQFCRDARA